jgi:hypothetical protein
MDDREDEIFLGPYFPGISVCVYGLDGIITPASVNYRIEWNANNERRLVITVYYACWPNETVRIHVRNSSNEQINLAYRSLLNDPWRYGNEKGRSSEG